MSHNNNPIDNNKQRQESKAIIAAKKASAKEDDLKRNEQVSHSHNTAVGVSFDENPNTVVDYNYTLKHREQHIEDDFADDFELQTKSGIDPKKPRVLSLSKTKSCSPAPASAKKPELPEDYLKIFKRDFVKISLGSVDKAIPRSMTNAQKNILHGKLCMYAKDKCNKLKDARMTCPCNIHLNPGQNYNQVINSAALAKKVEADLKSHYDSQMAAFLKYQQEQQSKNQDDQSAKQQPAPAAAASSCPLENFAKQLVNDVTILEAKKNCASFIKVDINHNRKQRQEELAKKCQNDPTNKQLQYQFIISSLIDDSCLREMERRTSPKTNFGCIGTIKIASSDDARFGLFHFNIILGDNNTLTVFFIKPDFQTGTDYEIIGLGEHADLAHRKGGCDYYWDYYYGSAEDEIYKNVDVNFSREPKVPVCPKIFKKK